MQYNMIFTGIFRKIQCVLFTFLFLITLFGICKGQYYGKLIGRLSELHHGVSGEVYAVDGKTLFIKDFTYDGQGPAAFFYASHYPVANRTGFPVKDEQGSSKVLKRYRKKGVTLTLPEGKHLNNIKIFYVWCEEFEVNFGDVKIAKNFDFPRPQKIDGLQGEHGVASDNIVVVDAQTLLIPNLSYDGQAPDAKFWVGSGYRPTPQGIRVPDENGKETPLRRYDRKTVVLTLPGDLTIFDIGHFGIWCEAFTVDFGHVKVPPQLNVPPSLKMLGISPQSKLNCEVLYDDLAFEVRWAVAGDSIVLQLVAKLNDREYMSFGVSGQDFKSVMVGGDVVVAWVDSNTLKGYADDYHLGGKSQCSGPTGSCPDNKLTNNGNNVRLLNAAMVNGYSIVTYQRPLRANDQYDQDIYTNRSQAIIWAIGPLNQRNEVSFHNHYTKYDQKINFGRPAEWNCPMPDTEDIISTSTTSIPPYSSSSTTISKLPPQRRRGSTNTNRVDVEKSTTTAPSRNRNPINRNRIQPQKSTTVAPYTSTTTQNPIYNKNNAWEIPPIPCYEPEDGVFYAQMGPTGGKRGYAAITGHVGWGISWYINGLLIPEINVVRGRTYTFVVEGGFDPEIPAKYHPFYITDDPVGGYEYKTSDERRKVQIYAGIDYDKDGNIRPIGTGRLCHWTQTGDIDADEFQSFGAYQRTLVLKCDQGEPGVINWTPDRNTPDTVYYQCFTHRYLGWKINVLDSCDNDGASTNTHAIVVPPPPLNVFDLEESASNTWVKFNQYNNPLVHTNEHISDTLIPSYTPPYALFNHQTVFTTTTEAPSTTTTTVKTPLQSPHFMQILLKIPMRTVTVLRSPGSGPLHPAPPPQQPQVVFYRKPQVSLRPLFYTKQPIIRPLVKILKYPQPQTNFVLLTPALNKNHLVQNEATTLRAVKHLPHAINTGFQPESIIIESGFVPIVRVRNETSRL